MIINKSARYETEQEGSLMVLAQHCTDGTTQTAELYNVPTKGESRWGSQNVGRR